MFYDKLMGEFSKACSCFICAGPLAYGAEASPARGSLKCLLCSTIVPAPSVMEALDVLTAKGIGVPMENELLNAFRNHPKTRKWRRWAGEFEVISEH